jgi:hypothetical protein
MFRKNNIPRDYKFIRKVVSSINDTKQIRACERLIDNWLNNYSETSVIDQYQRIITANRLRDFLIDTVIDKFPNFEYEPR